MDVVCALVLRLVGLMGKQTGAHLWVVEDGRLPVQQYGYDEGETEGHMRVWQ